MTIAVRLHQMRGNLSRKDFSAQVGVHTNTVANYESGRDPPISYLMAVAKRYGVRLDWLITGQGLMRDGDDEPTFFAEKLSYAVGMAIDRYYGDAANSPSLDDRARVLRAVSKYLVGVGVREQRIPDRESLIGMVKLTGRLLGVATPRTVRR
jgi:transcriptional regulator with XRE-family HTH domain